MRDRLIGRERGFDDTSIPSPLLLSPGKRKGCATVIDRVREREREKKRDDRKRQLKEKKEKKRLPGINIHITSFSSDG